MRKMVTLNVFEAFFEAFWMVFGDLESSCY